MQRGSPGLGLPDALALLDAALQTLVDALVRPGARGEYGLTMDRLDALGNAAATLIALNPSR